MNWTYKSKKTQRVLGIISGAQKSAYEADPVSRKLYEFTPTNDAITQADDEHLVAERKPAPAPVEARKSTKDAE